jgi:hypothetical protein
MTNPQLFIGLLIEAALGAVVLIIIASLLSRFTRDIIGRSLLVISCLPQPGPTSDSPLVQLPVRFGR